MTNLSIKQKSYLAVIILLVILVAMGFLFVYQVRGILWERTNSYTVQSVEKLSHDIDMLLGELDRAISSLSFDPHVLALFSEGEDLQISTSATAALKRVQDLLPHSITKGDLLIINKETKVIASTAEELVGKYRTLGVEWINKVMEASGDSVRITGHSVSKGMNLPTTRIMNIARGLFVDGKYQGMLMLDIPISVLEERSSHVEIGANGFVSVIDGDNFVMFSTDWMDTGNQFKLLSLADQESSPLTGYIGGEKMLIVHTKSEFSGITVVGAMPVEDVYAPAKRLTSNIIFLIVGFALAILLVAIVIVLTVSRPILRLAEKMKEVEEGDLSVRVIEARDDEIGVLEKGFNNMLERVEDLVDREYRANLGEREAQLNELTTVINPHFIYNTLEAIKMKAYLNNDHAVVEMLTGLARLFRIMTHTRSRYISLEEELYHCRTYLEIMHYKKDPAIDAIFEIPDELLSCATLKFLLQPLVENSIFHGFSNQSKGTIIIKAIADETTIVLSVCDDGEGIENERLKELNAIFDDKVLPAQRPLALHNIHERIQLAFGNDYGLSIINNSDGRGTTAILTIPRIPGDLENMA